GTWAVQLSGNTIQLVYTPGTGTPYSSWATTVGLTAANNGAGVDADSDGRTNLTEFALNGNPLSGRSDGTTVRKLATAGTDRPLTLTIPVRNGASFGGTTELTATVDGVVYRIQGTDDLVSWNLAVAEVTGADAAAIQIDLP